MHAVNADQQHVPDFSFPSELFVVLTLRASGRHCAREQSGSRCCRPSITSHLTNLLDCFVKYFDTCYTAAGIVSRADTQYQLRQELLLRFL
jgi:hypothetical protein